MSDFGYIKGLSRDKRSKNRLRFSSSKQKSQYATADVYRSYKRRIGVTTAAAREERVHHDDDRKKAKKKARTEDTIDTKVEEMGSKTLISTPDDEDQEDHLESTFAQELDISLDRNASEIFAKFYRQVWPLSRSLPEVLHHAPRILELLLRYLLSLVDRPEEATPPDREESGSCERIHYVANLATTDILHLLAVLARDMRHELHPFLFETILPRIFLDLLNPPLPVDGSQLVPLDVVLVEAAFRTVAYIFRYDAAALVDEGLETMRQYYGMLLGNKRELIRRLAAEVMGPLIRKLNDADKKRHVKRIVKALAAAVRASGNKERLLTDTTDGISSLCFETSRGVAGEIHTKGRFVLPCLLGCMAKEPSEIVLQVVTAYVSKILYHVTDKGPGEVVKQIVKCTTQVARGDPGFHKSVTFLLRLLDDTVAYHHGKALKDKSCCESLYGLLGSLVECTAWESSMECRSRAVKLLATVWTTSPDGLTALEQRLSLLGQLMGAYSDTKDLLEAHQSESSPAAMVLERLLPSVSSPEAWGGIASILLAKSCDLMSSNESMALSLLHAISSAPGIFEVAPSAFDSDETFFLEHASLCTLTSKQQSSLMDYLISSKMPWKAEWVGVVGRCAAFVSLVSVHADDERNINKEALSASSWIHQSILSLLKDESHDQVSIGLLIDSLAKLGRQRQDDRDFHRHFRKLATELIPKLEYFLLSSETSLILLKGVAGYAQMLEAVDLTFSADVDAFFDKIAPLLSHQNHFCRLHSLELLQIFPKRPFVVDHADLDLTEDLDEEAAEGQSLQTSAKTGRTDPIGLCNLIDILHDIELIPIEVSNERRLSSMIGRVEVIGRSGKLPIMYAESAAAHMIGLLNVKFALVWPSVVKALVALTKGHEQQVWPRFHAAVEDFMTRTAPAESTEGSSLILSTLDVGSFLDGMRSWSARGSPRPLFSAAIDHASELGKVSKHAHADDVTVLESLWKVVAEAPDVLAKHSRPLVTIFLDFMVQQYYQKRSRDPDARELNLEQHVTRCQGNFDSKLPDAIVQKRLRAMLKAFKAVKGPEQLYKNEVLLSIYNSLLVHSDQSIASLAFDCILNFKQRNLVRHQALLKNLFSPKLFREALLQLKTDADNEVITTVERKQMMSVVSRIVVGRLSSRAGAAKSSKDSPGSRRSAALAFMATFAADDEDLYPFVYLLLRGYIPASCNARPLEAQDAADRAKLAESVLSLTSSELEYIPSSVHEGFLHMLDAAISQLGFRVKSYVPAFVSVVEALLGVYAAGEKRNESIRISEEKEQDGEQGDSPHASNRKGKVRSLAYRRMSQMLLQFGGLYDFEPDIDRLLRSQTNALINLPVMAATANNAPGLLELLSVASAQPALRFVLSRHGALPAVIRCLDATSCVVVVDCVLTLLSNFLTPPDADATSDHDAPGLVKPHIVLIAHHFHERIALTKSSRSKTIWRRELSILLRLCDLIGVSGEAISDELASKVEALCSVLATLLEPGCGSSDNDRVQILDVVERLSVHVREPKAQVLFVALSRLLYPGRGKAGLLNRAVREGICRVLKALATSYGSVSAVVEVCESLSAMSRKRVDEIDYDAVIPTLGALSDHYSPQHWTALCANMPSLLSPAVAVCFFLLYEEDGVVSRGALKALTSLLHVSLPLAVNINSQNAQNDWKRFLESLIVPQIRGGLQARSEAIRRYFILLMRELTILSKDSNSVNLHGDLFVLVREDEPDLDFFLSFTHVQLHRRTRALQRLQKTLDEDLVQNESSSFSVQSLSGALTQLALHPIYETTQKIEEPFALEAIATLGAIAKHLSWSKYSALLINLLEQFGRHEQQERYMIGAICAVIDGFHFEIKGDEGIQSAHAMSTSGIGKVLNYRMIPKVESLLLREKETKDGSKTKILRAPVILALLKLFRKLSSSVFEERLPRLLTKICIGLKSRDSGARDVARGTLCKMVHEMGLQYLPDVLRELTLGLKEGYQLHVRVAVVQSLLLSIAEARSSSQSPPTESLLDTSVPALVDILQQDLFGDAQERRDAEFNSVRYVKEAGGTKAMAALETLATLITFRPSLAVTEGVRSSSIHVMILPFIERLKSTDLRIKAIRRIRESFNRICGGLARNPSVTLAEALPFIRASIEPFIAESELLGATRQVNLEEDSDEDDDAKLKPIRVAGDKQTHKEDRREDDNGKGSVMVWRPTTKNKLLSVKAANEAKLSDRREQFRVQDGRNAPKMTGSRRNKHASTKISINDPASISAVCFGLQLLSTTTKKASVGSLGDMSAAFDPLVPMLATCVVTCRDFEVVLLALRVLGTLLRHELPSLRGCARPLAGKVLELLVSAGSSTGTEQEVLQASFKMLTALINFDRSGKADRSSVAMIRDGENALQKTSAIPLDSDQMKVLVSFLKASLTDSDQHNPAIGLVKALVARRFVSPEFYDLMETLLELTVRSSKPSLRQQCSNLFVIYLQNYPLADTRVEQHLKQVVRNLKYEYAEGRLSAIALVESIVNMLPEDLLERHAQLFFLPLTLQLANDESDDCRRAVAGCLKDLVSHVSTETYKSMLVYVECWFEGQGILPRLALQLYGIFIDVRPDAFKGFEGASALLDKITPLLSDNNDWEVKYFALLCLETLLDRFEALLRKRTDLWTSVVANLIGEHPWVNLASARLLQSHLSKIKVSTLKESGVFLVQNRGDLFQIARNLCFVINSEESRQNEDFTTIAVKILTWTLTVMHKHPDLAYAANDQQKDPVQWVLKRLAGAAKTRGSLRRQAVYKCFAAFATLCRDFVFDKQSYLECMLEPLQRTELETRNELEAPGLLGATTDKEVSDESQLAKDVLYLIEEQCDNPEKFVKALGAVRSQHASKKEQRKVAQSVEAVVDPVAAAQKKQKRREREKARRKRKVDERRQDRGAQAKRSRHVD